MLSPLSDFKEAMLVFYQTKYASPLGPITLLSDATSLRGLWFADQKYFGAQYDLAAASHAPTAILTATSAWLTAYFAGQRPTTRDLPLAPDVTAFRQRVLAVIAQVPFGQTITYQQIAAKLGQPSAVRAVGGAVGHNPLSLVIPCHRVVGSDGSLTGYAGGLDRKIALLTLEGADPQALRAGKIR